MKVGAVCNPEVIGIQTTDSLLEAAQTMSRRHVGALMVFEDGRLAGVISEADLVSALAEDMDPRVTPVEDFMTPGAVTIALDDDTELAKTRMRGHGIHHLPVVESDQPVGMISAGDLMGATAAAWNTPLIEAVPLD